MNFIDCYFRSGTYQAPLPLILGREAAGTIVKVGSSVPSAWGLQEGDRVVWSNATGAYAEYVAVLAQNVVKIPGSESEISDEIAAGGFLMGLTALSLMEESYQVKKGDTILIHAAAGGTGKLMCQVAKAKGAKVIGTAGGEEKCRLAKENGADEVIDYNKFSKKEEWLPKVLELTENGEGVDAVFDGVGKATADGSLDVIKRKGTVVFFGASSGPVPDIPVRYAFLFFFSSPLTSSLGQQPPLPSQSTQDGTDKIYYHTRRLQAKNSKLLRPTMNLYVVTREEMQYYAGQFFEWVRSGKMRIQIHKTYALEDVKTAHEVMLLAITLMFFGD